MRKHRLPVWFMRQAGRYHSHYQNIRKNSDFMTMCKTPELATEITMGPINDFDFDAAILFSDLLFPLEQLNMGLSYQSGPPTLEVKIDELNKIERLKVIEGPETFYKFQKDALELLKKELPQDKTLLGFVGAPFTLYTYAVEGSHKGNIISAKTGLYDGRYQSFLEFLIPNLETNIAMQAEGGADAICLFDTAAGELTPESYKEYVIPPLKMITKNFKDRYPNKKIIYYSKSTTLDHLLAIDDENIDVLGVDWRIDILTAMDLLSDKYYVQGNLDPSYLFLPWEKLEKKLDSLVSGIKRIDRWIFGLGHGVLPKTPEENVKKVVTYIHSL